VLEIRIENAQQKPSLLRAVQAKVELTIFYLDFPNGKSG
jgi:glutaredoxin